MAAILMVFSYFIAKGLQDAILSTGKGFNSDNKYKYPKVFIKELSPIYKAYHQAIGATYKEKYFLSASLLVMFTDWWHFAGFLRHLSVYAMCFIITDYNVILTAIICTMALICFNFVYSVTKSFMK